jgi:glycosyltransferase involved in cell wall biosynthesis
MKLLYIVPKVKNAGGVARVLAIKANYFVENFGYEVHILSQNEEEILPFFNFNNKIVFHNMNLKGAAFGFFIAFKKSVNQKINEVKPNVILVADNGLKAFTYPFILKTKTPIVFECHGSKFVEDKANNGSFLLKFKYKFKNFAAGKFNESLQEWNVSNACIIPNPAWIETEITSGLNNKKVIAIARYSYEKGLDRLLLIWEIVIKNYPNWILDIYTDDVDLFKSIVADLGLNSNVNIFNFVKNIEEKYLDASVYLMTSRSEGFPMVLLEAMTFGLPCIAYDCPSGLNSIIKNGENGFLIPNDNVPLFVEKLSFLMENEGERLKFGANAKESTKKFSVDTIMEQWKLLLEKLKTN